MHKRLFNVPGKLFISNYRALTEKFSDFYIITLSQLFKAVSHIMKKVGTLYINFAHIFSRKCVPFLDLGMHLIHGGLTTNLQVKSTYRHQYSHYASTHANSITHYIVYSQALRVSRISSRDHMTCVSIF